MKTASYESLEIRHCSSILLFFSFFFFLVTISLECGVLSSVSTVAACVCKYAGFIPEHDQSHPRPQVSETPRCQWGFPTSCFSWPPKSGTCAPTSTVCVLKRSISKHSLNLDFCLEGCQCRSMMSRFRARIAQQTRLDSPII